MNNNVILLTCKELIDDARLGCTEIVFKDVCLEILAKAKHVLDERQFEELSSYAAERLKEKLVCNPRNR